MLVSTIGNLYIIFLITIEAGSQVFTCMEMKKEKGVKRRRKPGYLLGHECALESLL